jgi:hypothetical protein
MSSNSLRLTTWNAVHNLAEYQLRFQPFSPFSRKQYELMKTLFFFYPFKVQTQSVYTNLKIIKSVWWIIALYNQRR